MIIKCDTDNVNITNASLTVDTGLSLTTLETNTSNIANIVICDTDNVNITNTSLTVDTGLSLTTLESHSSNILSAITNGLLVQNLPKTIQQHREEGNVFSLSMPFSATNKLFYFHNPSGSGVKAYIYNIIVSSIDDGVFYMYKCDNVISVNTPNYNVNLKFDSGNTSSMKWEKTTTALSNQTMFFYCHCDAGGSTVVNDFKESMIEITEGTTLCIDGSMGMAVTLEYIETSANI